MTLHFGFSYTGLIYLFMLMIPNIIWTKNQPKDYDKYVRNENKILLHSRGQEKCWSPAVH